MRHPKRPGIIDAKIAEEYVVCGICLTNNRIVSHRKAVRPVCGRCGYPLPDPFRAQPGIRSFAEWIARYRRALVTIMGLLLVGLFAWLTSGKEERSSALPRQQAQQPVVALIDHRRAPAYAVAVVVRREAPTDTDDEQVDFPPGSLPSSRTESQSVGLYGLGTPNTETRTKSESVVIVIDVCAGRTEEHFQAGDGRDGELPGVFVSSYLQQMRDDPLDPLVGPHVVEQIHLNTGLDPRS